MGWPIFRGYVCFREGIPPIPDHKAGHFLGYWGEFWPFPMTKLVHPTNPDPPSHTPGASKQVLLTPYEDMTPRGFLGQGTNAEPQLLQPLPGSCDFSDTRCRGARGSTSISPSADMAAPLGPLATGPDALNSAEGMSKRHIDIKSLT